MKFYYVHCGVYEKDKGIVKECPLIAWDTKFGLVELMSTQSLSVAGKKHFKTFHKKQLENYDTLLIVRESELNKKHELSLTQLKTYMKHYRHFEIAKVTKKMNQILASKRKAELDKMDEEINALKLELKKRKNS